jgi:hypothetical protein
MFTGLIYSGYSEFRGFRLLLASQLFFVDFDQFRSKLHLFKAAGAVSKIGLSSKLNQHCQI